MEIPHAQMMHRVAIAILRQAARGDVHRHRQNSQRHVVGRPQTRIKLAMDNALQISYYDATAHFILRAGYLSTRAYSMDYLS